MDRVQAMKGRLNRVLVWLDTKTGSITGAAHKELGKADQQSCRLLLFQPQILVPERPRGQDGFGFPVTLRGGGIAAHELEAHAKRTEEAAQRLAQAAAGDEAAPAELVVVEQRGSSVAGPGGRKEGVHRRGPLRRQEQAVQEHEPCGVNEILVFLQALSIGLFVQPQVQLVQRHELVGGRHDLLVQRLRVALDQPVRSGEEVPDAPEHELAVLVAIAHEIGQDAVHHLHGGQLPVDAGPADGIHDHQVADLIVVHAGGKLVLKRLVPQADAVEREDVAAHAQAELHVVHADEHRKRQAVVGDLGHGDAAVPPGVEVKRHFDLVFQHVLDLPQIQRKLAALHIPSVPVAAAFVLLPAVVQPQHRPGDGLSKVLGLQEPQQLVGAQQRVGVDQHVVVHHQHVGKILRVVDDLHHAACEAAGSARVLVGKDMDAFALQARDVQRSSVVGDEDLHVPAQIAIRVLNDLPVQQSQVALNERLAAECADVHGDVDAIELVGVNLGRVRAAIQRAILAEGVERAAYHAAVGDGKRNVEVEGFPRLGPTDALKKDVVKLLVADHLPVHESDLEFAAQLQPQAQILEHRVLAPLADGEGVEIGVQIQMRPPGQAHCAHLRVKPGRVFTLPGSEIHLKRRAGVRIRKQQFLQDHLSSSLALSQSR